MSVRIHEIHERSSSERRCPYCHDDVDEETACACSECRTLLHPECLEVLTRCPTIGCPGSVAAFVDAGGSPPSVAVQDGRTSSAERQPAALRDVGDLATRPLARAAQRTLAVSCAIGLTLAVLLVFASGHANKALEGLILGLSVGLVTFPVALIEFSAERRPPGSALHGLAAVLAGITTFLTTRLLVPLSGYATLALRRGHGRGLEAFHELNELVSAPDVLWGFLALVAPFAIATYARLARWSLGRQVVTGGVASGLLTTFGLLINGVALGSGQGITTAGVAWVVGSLLPLIYRGIDLLQARFSRGGARPGDAPRADLKG